MVEGCAHTKQTFWTEDEFTVTVSSGIRNCDERVVEIVVREIEKVKPVVMCVVSRAMVTTGGEAGASWTLLVDEVRQGSGK
jgi:hypothetical protein